MNTRQDNGFTLLEVLIAIAIFSYGILAVATMQIRAITGNASSMKQTNATLLASKKIEDIMIMGYDMINDNDFDGENGLDDEGFDADGHAFNIKCGGKGTRYDIYWNVAEDVPLTENKTVRLIITWRDEGRHKKAFFDFIKLQGE
ncbi:MAG: type IV pilus modification PilV family protein [bacterium]